MNDSAKMAQLLQQVSAIVPNFCDRCGTKHMKTDLEVIDRNSDKVVCKLSCNNCKNTYIIHVSTNSDGIISSRRAFKPDISSGEFQKFSKLERINNEEILDVFIALKGIDTMDDFSILFGSKDK